MKYDSKREAEYARELDLRMSARDPEERVESWERQVPFKLIANDVLICTYRCDFQVRYADGRKELVEIKGYWTAEAKLKRKLFEALVLKDHPELTYRVVR